MGDQGLQLSVTCEELGNGKGNEQVTRANRGLGKTTGRGLSWTDGGEDSFGGQSATQTHGGVQWTEHNNTRLHSQHWSPHFQSTSLLVLLSHHSSPTTKDLPGDYTRQMSDDCRENIGHPEHPKISVVLRHSRCSNHCQVHRAISE